MPSFLFELVPRRATSFRSRSHPSSTNRSLKPTRDGRRRVTRDQQGHGVNRRRMRQTVRSNHLPRNATTGDQRAMPLPTPNHPSMRAITRPCKGSGKGRKRRPFRPNGSQHAPNRSRTNATTSRRSHRSRANVSRKPSSRRTSLQQCKGSRTRSLRSRNRNRGRSYPNRFFCVFYRGTSLSGLGGFIVVK